VINAVSLNRGTYSSHQEHRVTRSRLSYGRGCLRWTRLGEGCRRGCRCEGRGGGNRPTASHQAPS